MSKSDNEFDFQDDDIFSSDEQEVEPSDIEMDELDEEGPESVTEPPKKPSRGGVGGIIDMIKAAPLAFGFGVAIILAALYMLNFLLSDSPDSKQKRPQQEQTQSFGTSVPEDNVASFDNGNAQKPVTTPQQSAAVGTPTQAAMSGNYIQMTKSDLTMLLQGFAKESAKLSEKLSAQISKLQASVSSDSHSQAALIAQIKSLAVQQDKLATSMEHYDKYLKDISSSLTKTQAQLQVLVAERAAHAEKLTLRAVVPGRAWLVNGKGKTITITVGDELDGFGKVVRIDSDDDKVYMSSGYVFS